MKISGFTFVRNADKLYYPIKASIESILPIVDEFVIALGNCDTDDQTRKEILTIKSDKLKIIETVWDTTAYPRGMEHAHQTDIAKEACKGDWLIYLQADELIHEKYLPTIQKACAHYLNDTNVEGFLLKYRHFYGDYQHYFDGYGWYPREIRIIRNIPEIHSYISAQSFRRIPNFDGKNYRIKEGTFKLKVILLDAYIYHYGWVRPPRYMQTKKKAFDTTHHGASHVSKAYANQPQEFDYGTLGNLSIFKDSHPATLQSWIAKFDWGHKLNYTTKVNPDFPRHKHEQLKYRIRTFIEKKVLCFKDKELGYNNWKIISKFPG
ncbi:glycosyltransferase family 2 protein [Xanthocytophaga agilis]|uniref:Glycosyltransferase family 2 protein n=1 Tax=Xanthocytophaga agilis TaxID=3048010 RepID=A0AAE3R8N6_9BACT|nr:glycosyltransferase family 2 protein [Xanthocytophaga agilis]MDJ1503434.1 glycosyltransferase family 2 protein [Xanthocytophaga agilis]